MTRTTLSLLALAITLACAVVASIVEASEREIAIGKEPPRVALKSSLLRAALTMPRPHDPGETDEEYRERLAVIVDAIGDEAKTRKLAFTVLVVWSAESRLDRRVHAGARHPVWTSDEGRAKCLGQLWPSSLVPDWSELAGTDGASTRRCARATVRVLLAQARLCRSRGEPSLAGALRAYATGRSCEPDAESLRREARVTALASRF